ncbi:phage tail tape measure protein [Falsiruegeria litorea]|uniref:phage tail tape measure protein n=1 Tax=Falsiruegeria litorea TaxID=1280831 RepID=UPI00203A3F0E|nr:hypothetical protein [Falsiruegeria litorea]
MSTPSEYNIKIGVTGSAELVAFQKHVSSTKRAVDAVGNELQQTSQQFEIYNRAVGRAGQTVRRQGTAFAGFRKNFTQSHNITNFSNQLGDFAVQVSGGTSALRAFGQQAPQALAFLGPQAAVVGAFIAVGAGLVAYFTNAASGAAKLAEELENLNQITEASRDLTEQLSAPLADLEKRFGDSAKLGREFVRMQLELRSASMTSELQAITAAMIKLNPSLDAARSRMTRLDGQNRRYAESLGLTVEQMREFSTRLTLVRDATGVDAVIARFTSLARYVEDIGLDVAALPPDIRDALLEMADLAGSSLEAQAAVESMLLAIQATPGSIDDATRAMVRFYQQVRAEAAVGLDAFGGVGPDINPPKPAVPPRPISIGGGGGGVSELDQFVKSLQAFRTEAQRTEDELKVLEEGLTEFYASLTPDQQALAQAGIQGLRDELKGLRTELDGVADTLATGFGTALGSLVDGTEAAKDAFKNMARSILEDLGKMAAEFLTKKLIFSLFGAGFAKGGVFDAGSVVPFARGGVVSSPTVFPMARGLGLMGEAGPEAIMPLRRGANGALGVESVKPNVEVVVNNFAPGTKAMTEERDGKLYVTVQDVRRIVATDVSVGGNQISKAMERTYRMSRGR